MSSCQALALGFAIISSRSTELPWQVRALRAVPVFALPAVVTLLYSTCASYHRMSKNQCVQHPGTSYWYMSSVYQVHLFLFVMCSNIYAVILNTDYSP